MSEFLANNLSLEAQLGYERYELEVEEEQFDRVDHAQTMVAVGVGTTAFPDDPYQIFRGLVELTGRFGNGINLNDYYDSNGQMPKGNRSLSAGVRSSIQVGGRKFYGETEARDFRFDEIFGLGVEIGYRKNSQGENHVYQSLEVNYRTFYYWGVYGSLKNNFEELPSFLGGNNDSPDLIKNGALELGIRVAI